MRGVYQALFRAAAVRLPSLSQSHEQWRLSTLVLNDDVCDGPLWMLIVVLRVSVVGGCDECRVGRMCCYVTNSKCSEKGIGQ